MLLCSVLVCNSLFGMKREMIFDLLSEVVYVACTITICVCICGPANDKGHILLKGSVRLLIYEWCVLLFEA